MMNFERDIVGSTQTKSMGNFEVTKVRIHDDLLQEGLKKKPAKSAASFVTIGEPYIELTVTPTKEGSAEKTASVEIKGLDIYDPHKRRSKTPQRSRHCLLDDGRRKYKYRRQLTNSFTK